MRFVGVQSSNSNSKGGRMEARAVLRLLVRSDNKEAVLFMDKIYFSSNRDATLEQQVRRRGGGEAYAQRIKNPGSFGCFFVFGGDGDGSGGSGGRCGGVVRST